MPLRESLEKNGYAIIPAILDPEEAVTLDDRLAAVPVAGAGTRSLFEFEWCRALARRLREHPLLAGALPASAVGVQCTLFDKTPERNWLVAYHQDLSVPVASRVDHPELRAWSQKEGQHFVQPPDALLRQLVAIRLHVDACGLDNGPLRVVPGSHLRGRLMQSSVAGVAERMGEVTCPVDRGDALLFKPLLLHASSKSAAPKRRRVLHFLFGPGRVGYGLRWHHAV